VNAALDQLVSSLLYEGYALYPYTARATKNATPTPFGIIYPPAHAARLDSAFDHLRIECVLEATAGAELELTVRFLQAVGPRHEAGERRLTLPRTPLTRLADGAGTRFELPGDPPLRGRLRLRATALAPAALYQVTACVHNDTDRPDSGTVDRQAALASSLLSTHVLIEASGGRFASPLEREGAVGAAVAACASVNTWPVLAMPDDSVVLGAPIVLPDHPRIAPESLGGLFDNTEIEEALLLHVHALSDDEREQIAAADPAVREMVERAAGATAEQMLGLHGRLEEVSEPGHPNPGERALEVEGVVYRKGAKVVLRPGTERDVYDRMLDGRTATIERIYLDYEDRAHIAVTVDDDPAQELFRETGRYLFFRAGELELSG
jgi:hypothetical protein